MLTPVAMCNHHWESDATGQTWVCRRCEHWSYGDVNDCLRPPHDGPGPDNGLLNPNVAYVPGINGQAVLNPTFVKTRKCYDCGVMTEDWVIESRESAQDVWTKESVHNKRRVCQALRAERGRMDELAAARAEVVSLESQLKYAREELENLEKKQ